MSADEVRRTHANLREELTAFSDRVGAMLKQQVENSERLHRQNVALKHRVEELERHCESLVRQLDVARGGPDPGRTP